ncbi:MAG: hypothetical protein R6U55_11980, partial [Desulfovermiculus sp.]
MLEEYMNLDMQVLLENDNLSRRIIHRLQAGQNIDAHLIAEYRFLETHYDIWSSFFAFMGYRLQRAAHGHEDHIGAAAWLWPHWGCPIYATPLAPGLLRLKFSERGLATDAIKIIEPGEAL